MRKRGVGEAGRSGETGRSGADGDTGRVSIRLSSMAAASNIPSSGTVEVDAGESGAGKSNIVDWGVAGTGDRRFGCGIARFAIESVSEGDVLAGAMAEWDVLARES